MYDEHGSLNVTTGPVEPRDASAQQVVGEYLDAALERLTQLTTFMYSHHPLTRFMWHELERRASRLHTLACRLSDDAFRIPEQPFAKFSGLVRLVVRCAEGLASPLLEALPPTLERLTVVLVPELGYYEFYPVDWRHGPGTSVQPHSRLRMLRVLCVVAEDMCAFMKRISKREDMVRALRTLKIRTRTREHVNAEYWNVLAAFAHLRALRFSNFHSVAAPSWCSTALRRLDVVGRRLLCHVSRWTTYSDAFPRIARLTLPLADDSALYAHGSFLHLAHLSVSGTAVSFSNDVLVPHRDDARPHDTRPAGRISPCRVRLERPRAKGTETCCRMCICRLVLGETQSAPHSVGAFTKKNCQERRFDRRTFRPW